LRRKRDKLPNFKQKEDVKLSLFTDDMILDRENPKESIKKPLELRN